MSIRTSITIQLNRLALLFAKSCRQSLQRKKAEAGKQFIRIHEDRRAELRLADEYREARIKAANKQAEYDRQNASKRAATREIALASKTSNVEADLYELEKNCRLS